MFSEIDTRGATSRGAIEQKMRNGIFKGYASASLVFRSYHKSMSAALSVRSTDRKYASRDFHKASEFDFSSTDSPSMSLEKTSAHRAHAPRSFNTVLMIYVSGYILHRILSRINVDTGSEEFLVLCTGEIFTFRAKVRPDVTIFNMLQSYRVSCYIGVSNMSDYFMDIT